MARAVPTGEACRNCGAELYGEFCYACGQPRVGWVRHVRELGADFVDSVLNIDGRFPRTLVTLFFRPGRMTVDYLAGARGRYASPFRLFFVLCVLAFLLLQLGVDLGENQRNDPAVAAIETAPTEEAVDQTLREALAPRAADAVAQGESAAESLAEGATERSPGAAALAEDRTSIERAAERRKQWIRKRDAAITEGRAPPRDPSIPRLQFGGEEWDATRNPIRIDVAPEAVNAALNQRAARLQRAIASARAEPEPIVAAIFAKLPLALLFAMPVFAALLKLVHWPRHRLYTEHLVVALHSHAFLFLALMLLSLGALLENLVASGGALERTLDLAGSAVLLWMPIYLLLMQKRVYGSRWRRTLIEYGVTGMAYVALLALAIAFGVIAGLLSL